jgi:hypothetical protein
MAFTDGMPTTKPRAGARAQRETDFGLTTVLMRA